MEIGDVETRQIEGYPLTFGPTPIEYLPRMTAALGGAPAINGYIYRNG